MEDMFFISIIVPVYNAERFIEGCIESLLALDYPKGSFEIIAVDNGSTDRSAELIKKYPVTYVIEKIKGPSAARNSGAKIARGSILAFTDADVIVGKNWLLEIKNSLLDQSIAGVMGLRLGINKNVWADLFQKYYEIFIGQRRSEGKMISRIDSANFAMRKKVFDDFKGFNPEFLSSEDQELGIRLFEYGEKIIFNEKMTVSHVNAVSLDQIINARREQSFYEYKIAYDRDDVFIEKHFPMLLKARYRLIFIEKGKVENCVLRFTGLFVYRILRIVVAFLRFLKAIGLKRGLNGLFLFAIGLSIYHGKILSRCVERKYLTISKKFKDDIFKYG